MEGGMFKKIKDLFFSIILFTIFIQCGPQDNSNQKKESKFDPSKSDAKAVQVVNDMWTALGGKRNWEKARSLSYHWIVEREGKIAADYRHDWDRHTNQYRVEGTDREGKHFIALFNTESLTGDVLVNGEILPDDSTRIKMLDRAYGRFINDSYWLIMPYKLKDPGVVLTYEGEKQQDGQFYDVVKGTFENVGLTPGDTYWAFINKSDHLMHKWEYVLEGREPPPTVAWWTDWRNVGGIKLAMNRKFEGRPVRIYFKDVVVSSEVDKTVFEME